MQTIGAFEAKTHLSVLLEQVERGEQVIITKHGRPVAKLVPATKVDSTRIRHAIDSLKVFNKKNTLGKLNWKTLRDEGRK